jgi:hypothetical protein
LGVERYPGQGDASIVDPGACHGRIWGLIAGIKPYVPGIEGRVYNRRKKAVGAPEGNINRSIQLDQSDPIERKSTAETLGDQFGVSAPTIKRDGQFAASVEAIKPYVPDIEARGVVLGNPNQDKGR